MTNFKFTSSWKFLILIFFISLLARLVYFSVPRTYPMEPQPGILISDASDYDEGAVNLVSGEGYKFGGWRAEKPPLYSFFLAGHYWLFGRNLMIVKITQAFLASTTTVFIFLIGRYLFGNKVGILASIFHIIYLPYLQYSFIIMSETLMFFLITLSFYLFLRAVNSKSLHYFIFSGVAVGLTILTKSSAIVIIAIFSFWFFIRLLSEKQFTLRFFFLPLTVFLLAIFLVNTPWLVRNWLLFRGVTLSTVGAFATWPAVNPKYGYWNPDAQYEMHYYFGQGVDELTWEKRVYKDTFRLIKTYPIFFISSSVNRLKLYWGIDSPRILYIVKNPTSISLYEIEIFFAAFGFILLFIKKKWLTFWFFLLIIVFFSISNMPTTTVPRYRWQIDWLLAILASYTIVVIFSTKLVKKTPSLLKNSNYFKK